MHKHKKKTGAARLLNLFAEFLRQCGSWLNMTRQILNPLFCALVLLAPVPFCSHAFGQSDATVGRAESRTPSMVAANRDTDSLPDAPIPEQQTDQTTASTAASQAAASQPHQTKRILYIVPNFRAVSSDQKLPPQTVKQKFSTATLDSVDYSSFIFVGIQAGIDQASKATPQFRQGAAGYGRYYWHTFADNLDENLWVEFILPATLKQDSRYYTQGHGGFPKRLAYSFSRIAITRNDHGSETFNASEIFGAGAAAGIANLYYPSAERTFTKTYQRWITSVTIDGATFVFKEFWPDINQRFFHQTD